MIIKNCRLSLGCQTSPDSLPEAGPRGMGSIVRTWSLTLLCPAMLMAQSGPTITTTSLPFGIVGVAYSAALSVANGTAPFTWTVNTASGPALVPGLNLNVATGLISGTPSSSNFQPVIQLPYVFQVTDSNGASATATLYLIIYTPLVISPASLPQGAVGTYYFECISDDGGALVDQQFVSHNITITNGSLPGGITFGLPEGGGCGGAGYHSPAISGVPTQSGTFPLTFSATDGYQVVTQSMTLVIAPAPTLAVSPSTLTFQYQLGGIAAASQTVTLTVPSGTNATYSVSTSTDSGGGWLQVGSVVIQSPTGGNSTFQASVSTTNQAGAFAGKITISSAQISNSPVTIPVSFTVLAAPSVNVSPASLSFSYFIGATSSQKTISVSSSQGTLAYAATPSTTAGGNWLSVWPSSGITPSNLSVLANPAGLPAGAYSGSVSISANTTTPGVGAFPATNSPQTVTVTMTVIQSPMLGVSPTLLSFAYQGGPTPGVQALALSSTGVAVSFTAMANASSGGSWLSVTPTSGTTPANLDVSVNPAGLETGTYSGNVTISPTGASNSPLQVSVTLVVSDATLKLSLSGLAPTSAPPGGPAFTLTVYGSGFVNGAVVNWNGSPLSTNFQGSPTQLTAAVPNYLIANSGTASVTVVNPGEVGTNAITFMVTPTSPLSIAQIVDGSSWMTQIQVVNLDQVPVSYSLQFWDDNGNPLQLPFVSGAAGTLSGTLAAGGTAFAETPGSSATLAQGWAQATSSGRIGVLTIFTQSPPGKSDSEGTVIGMQSGGRVFLPFDDTNGYVTGLAVANTNATQTLLISLQFQTDQGATSAGSLSLPPHGHTAFVLSSMFPSLTGLRGVIEFTAPTPDIAVVGLRFSPTNSFTSLGIFQ